MSGLNIVHCRVALVAQYKAFLIAGHLQFVISNRLEKNSNLEKTYSRCPENTRNIYLTHPVYPGLFCKQCGPLINSLIM